MDYHISVWEWIFCIGEKVIDLNWIINQYRTNPPQDILHEGMRINRLFGLNNLILENLNSDSVVCEIGSYWGASSCLFAYYCKKVFCIDYFNQLERYEAGYDKNISCFDNIVKIKSFSLDGVSLFKDNYFDIVYLDASHEYKDITGDINAWKPKIKNNGFISGHDYQTLCPGVIRAVDELLGKPDKIYEDSSWIKRL
jgi:hypothetical protein